MGSCEKPLHLQVPPSTAAAAAAAAGAGTTAGRVPEAEKAGTEAETKTRRGGDNYKQAEMQETDESRWEERANP